MTDFDRFAAWTEKLATREIPDLDISRLLGITPFCAIKTIKERVEPFATEYDSLTDQLPWLGDDGPPDPRFYRPTPRLRRIWKRLDELRPQAFRTVLNPEYTEECAEEWERNRRKPFNQTKIVIGQSYNPPEQP